MATLAELPLERMKANVAAIHEPGEKERWEANLLLWKFVMADGTPYFKEVPAVKFALETMAKNVGAITELPEKERWELNLELWRMKLEVPATTRAKMTGLLDRMEANVMKIVFVPERERWLANRDLWEFALRPM